MQTATQRSTPNCRISSRISVVMTEASRLLRGHADDAAAGGFFMFRAPL
jgi:hypothetical protein